CRGPQGRQSPVSGRSKAVHLHGLQPDGTALRPAIRGRCREPHPCRARSGAGSAGDGISLKGTEKREEIMKRNPSRRSVLKTVAVAAGFPTIVPSTVFGQTAPSNRINVGAIGVGRISRVHDLPAIRKVDFARIVAVCDLDAERVEQGKILVNGFYDI